MMAPPDSEVPKKKARGKFTAKYKLQILQQADACWEFGQVRVLLCSKGLYFSNLANWRKRSEKENNQLAPRVAELDRETERLQRKLKRAASIIEFQKGFQRS